MGDTINTPDSPQSYLDNPAEVQGAERIYCEECLDRVIFRMKDAKGNQFRIGMKSVLDCLMFGIENGDLPKLPGSWCSMTGSEYHHPIAWTEGISYFDLQGSREAQAQARGESEKAEKKKEKLLPDGRQSGRNRGT